MIESIADLVQTDSLSDASQAEQCRMPTNRSREQLKDTVEGHYLGFPIDEQRLDRLAVDGRSLPETCYGSINYAIHGKFATVAIERMGVPSASPVFQRVRLVPFL